MKVLNSKHKLLVADNLLSRNFNVKKSNLHWVSDITYIQTKEGWLYLAVILDLYSKKVIGWSMSNRMSSDIVVNALDMAVRNRDNVAGVILHSDRGVPYASKIYQDKMK